MHFSNLQAYNICRVYFLLSNKLWTYFRSTYIFVHRFMDHSLFSKIASKFRIFFFCSQVIYHAHSFIYCLWQPSCYKSGAGTTDAGWPAEPSAFALWHFVEKVFWSLIWRGRAGGVQNRFTHFSGALEGLAGRAAQSELLSELPTSGFSPNIEKWSASMAAKA